MEPLLPSANHAPPSGRASRLESQLKAILYGNTAPPDPLRLPTPTWVPPTTQNRRRIQLPPPPPSTDSASTSDQSQQTTAADLEHEEQGTQRPGRAKAHGRTHKLVSEVPHQPHTSQPAQGRSGGASQSAKQRAPDWNPLAKISTHRSRGWKKDLDCYMGAYFWLNYPHEPTSKWPELKAKFFEFLIGHHSEWKSIRNNDPLGYLAYMETHFERVTSYMLVGLGACTEWIRAGTYYHWVIAQQGQLGRCPRLASVPVPQGPMMPPPYPPVTVVASTQATIPETPQGGGGQPGAESQPRKRDAATAGVQGTARSMGGAGDSSTRSGRGESREPRTARSSSRKHRRSQSRRRDQGPTVPFPLQEHKGRLQAVRMYEEARESRLASEMTTLRGLREGHPELGAEELQRLNNQVLLMIAEYHLTSASQGSHHVLPVLPEAAAWLMPPLDDYLPGSFDGCRDVRVTDRAQILCVAVWLHRLDLRATYGVEVAASPRVEEYDTGPLLKYFLMPKLSDITPGEVTSRVAQENRRDMEISLRELHEERDSLENEIGLWALAHDNEQRKEAKKTLKKRLDTSRRELRSTKESISRLEELLGSQQSQEPPTGQGHLDVIIEETTETTMVTANETEWGHTLGGPDCGR